VRYEDPRSSADRCGEDRDVFRIRKLAGPVVVVRCRALDLD
jgi:hypothetical protein